MSAFNSSIFLHSASGEENQFVAGAAVGLATILTTVAVYYAFSFKDKQLEFPKLPGVQLYHAREFFHRRFDFIRSNTKRNPGGFSFNVLQHKVISLAGEDARQAFLTDPHLNSSQGYSILMGGVCVFLVQP